MKLKAVVVTAVVAITMTTGAHAQGYNRYSDHYSHHHRHSGAGVAGAVILGGVLGFLAGSEQPHYGYGQQFVPGPTYDAPQLYYAPTTVYIPGHYETR